MAQNSSVHLCGAMGAKDTRWALVSAGKVTSRFVSTRRVFLELNAWIIHLSTELDRSVPWHSLFFPAPEREFSWSHSQVLEQVTDLGGSWCHSGRQGAQTAQSLH